MSNRAKWNKCSHCGRVYSRPKCKQFCNRTCSASYREQLDRCGSFEQRRTILVQRILECTDLLARETRAWLRVTIRERMADAQKQKDYLEHKMRHAMERA